MRIILVSHGETETYRASNGSTPLSVSGLRQAQVLAGELRNTVARRSAIGQVYAAEGEAAAATAMIISTSLNLPTPIPLHGLISHAALIADEASPGEALDAMRAIQDEAWEAIEQLRDAHPDEAAQVIAVAPTLTVHAIVCRALGLPIERYRRLRVDRASWSTLAFRQNRTILACLNEACFLDR